MPAAPRTWARSARMSPTVPAVGSPRASMTRISPGPHLLDGAFLGVQPAAAQRAAVLRRTGPRGTARSAASWRTPPSSGSGLVACSRSRVTELKPRLRSWDGSVAVVTLETARAGRPGSRRARGRRGCRRRPRAARRRRWASRRAATARSRPRRSGSGACPWTAAAAVRGCRRARDLDLDQVARVDHRGPGGGAGEDHVARLEGGQPGEVGDDVGEGEQQVVAADRVLRELAVDPGPQRDALRVDGPARRAAPGRAG